MGSNQSTFDKFLHKYFNFASVLFSILITAFLSFSVSYVYLGNTDASWMNFLTRHYNFGDEIYISSHTAITKFPLTIIFDSIFGYGLTSQIFTTIIILTLTSLLILLIVRTFYNNDSLSQKTIKTLLFTLVLTCSSEFFMFTGLNSSRNIEYAMLIWIYFIISRKLNTVKNFTNFELFNIYFLTLLLTLSDELNITILVIPLLIHYIVQIISTHSLKSQYSKLYISILLPSLISVFLLKTSILQIFNIYITSISDFYFISLEKLPILFTNLLYTIIHLQNSDFMGGPVSLSTISSVLTFIISIYSFYILLKFGFQNTSKITSFTNEKLFILFIALGVIGNIFIYSLSHYSGIPGTGRYLAFITIGNAIFIALKYKDLFQNLFFNLSIIFTLIILILVNTFNTDQKFIQNQSNLNYFNEISGILKENKLTIGYGDFWNSYSVSLLTESHTPIVPISNCEPFYLYNLSKFYQIKPDFVILDVSNANSNINCSDEDIESHFGKISKKIPVSTPKISTMIYILQK